MVDFFVAPLRCPVCGEVSPADSSTQMQTSVPCDARGGEWTIGDEIVLTAADFEAHSYLPVVPVIDDEPIHSIEIWTCAKNGHYPNWAEVVIANGVIEKIDAVEPTVETFERANFITGLAIHDVDRLPQPVADFIFQLYNAHAARRGGNG